MLERGIRTAGIILHGGDEGEGAVLLVEGEDKVSDPSVTVLLEIDVDGRNRAFLFRLAGGFLVLSVFSLAVIILAGPDQNSS